jgi:putative tryptophan/tyrosine transport system substrate-binding protein
MMKRRTLIAGLGSAAAWSVVARGQQSSVPVIGVLWLGDQTPLFLAAFRRGLAEAGFIEGRNISIEFRFLGDGLSQLPDAVADLMRRRVSVIATPGSTPVSLAAKAATNTIPIVFGNASNPVEVGLVESLSSPGANVTGFSEMNGEVWSKRFGLLRSLAPPAEHLALLVNPKNQLSEFFVRDARAAAASMGEHIDVISATNAIEIDAAFADAAQKRIDALLLLPDALFFVNRAKVIALAARGAIPTAYWDRTFPIDGGLLSYGSNLEEMYRQVATYVGRILKGEKPANMPVARATKFELVINAKTAKALGRDIPPTLFALADEVIE